MAMILRGFSAACHRRLLYPLAMLVFAQPALANDAVSFHSFNG
jgi:hypothetical protein